MANSKDRPAQMDKLSWPKKGNNGAGGNEMSKVRQIASTSGESKGKAKK